MANGVYRATCAAGAVIPAVVPPVARITGRTFGNRSYVDHSARVFTQSRTVRFREMAYAVPVDQLVPAIRDIQHLIAERGSRIPLPPELHVATGTDRGFASATRPQGIDTDRITEC